MDKIKKCESFEREDGIDKSLIKNKLIPKSHNTIKILFFVIFLIISSIIYLIFINSEIEMKEKEITQLNVKSFLVSDVNQKNDRKMAEIYNILDKLDKELKNLENEISLKDESLTKYQNLINDLKMDNENIIYVKQIESLKKLNEDKADQVEKLLKKLRELKFGKTPLVEIQHSIIFDTKYELEFFRRRLHGGYLKYIYGINSANTTKTLEKCENTFMQKDGGYMIVFQNDLFDRFGFFISNHPINQSLIFNINELGKYSGFHIKDNKIFVGKTQLEDINISSNEENNLELVIELIQKMNKRNYYKNLMKISEDSSLSEMMEESFFIFNITEMEIYYV